MNLTGVVILLAALALSVVIAVLTHGHVLFLGIPLLVGLPLASVFGRTRR